MPLPPPHDNDKTRLGLSPPNVEIDAAGTVRNLDYGDIYFSAEDGRAESTYVFLDGNQLSSRFADLAGDDVFTIGELGFGTGLNFLLTWELFRQTAPKGARLCFMSCERHPMNADQFQRILTLFPDISELGDKLAQRLPPPVKGTHTLFFDGGRVRLTLLLGNAEQTLPEAHAHVDAWFLDGFAPAKNADMWAEQVIKHIARLSHTGTTFATFTAAGAVRRALVKHGFSVEKIRGYGRKRDMIVGSMPTKPKMNDAHPYLPSTYTDRKEAMVIGAGIAGACTAYALAIRDWDVTVIDRQIEPAQEASGNPRGAMYPKLGAEATPATRLAICSFNFASQLIDFSRYIDRAPCGSLTLDFSPERQKRHRGIIDNLALPTDIAQKLTPEQATEISGIAMDCGGLYTSLARSISPRDLCQHLLTHSRIRLIKSAQVTDISYDDNWIALDKHGQTIAQSPIAIIAMGKSLASLTQTRWLKIEHTRGQITRLPGNAVSQNLKCIINHKGYILPVEDSGDHIIGATFDRHNQNDDISPEDNVRNVKTLTSYIPALQIDLSPSDIDQLKGRASVRVAVNDRLPLAGPCPDFNLFLKTHSGMRQGKKVLTNAPLHQGLFMTGAHGSHGLTTAPLCGELIAALLSGDPLPLEISLYEKIMPARMILRGLKRREL